MHRWIQIKKLSTTNLHILIILNLYKSYNIAPKCKPYCITSNCNIHAYLQFASITLPRPTYLTSISNFAKDYLLKYFLSHHWTLASTYKCVVGQTGARTNFDGPSMAWQTNHAMLCQPMRLAPGRSKAQGKI